MHGLIARFSLLFVPLIFISESLHARGYIEYHQILNRINRDIINQSYNAASIRFDSLFEKFDFIYAHHAFQSLQIECSRNDSIKIIKRLQKCYLQGITKETVENNEYIVQSPGFRYIQSSVINSDSLNTVYDAGCNKHLKKIIDSLYILDQNLTFKVNHGFFILRPIYLKRFRKNNIRQHSALLEIIAKYGYPGERLIGFEKLDAQNIATDGIMLVQPKCTIMLIHCINSGLSLPNSTLLNNLEGGYLTPFELGTLLDFKAQWGKDNERKFYGVYFKKLNQGGAINSNENINLRRKAIGLRSIEEQAQNDSLYTARLRNKALNKVIILDL